MFGLIRKKTSDKRVAAAHDAQLQRISNLVKTQEISETALRKRQGEKVTDLRLKYNNVIRKLQTTNDDLIDDLQSTITQQNTEIKRLGEEIKNRRRGGTD